MKKTAPKGFIFDGKPYPIKRLFLRLLDISFLGILYFIGGITFSWFIEMVDSSLDKNQEREKIKTITLIAELLIFICCLMIFSYFLRNLIKKIPSPFHNLWGYSHTVQAELNGGIIISFAIIVLLTTFKENIQYLFYDRLKIL